MSLLRQKLDIKPGLPDSIKENMGIWDSLHQSLCGIFSELIQTALEPDSIEVSFGDLKSLLSKTPDGGLYFGYGQLGGQCRVLTCFDSGTAARLTTQSLGLSETLSEEAYIPKMLDLLLFKPAVDVLNAELGALFAPIIKSASLHYGAMGQHLSAKPFDLPLDAGYWNQINFSIRPVENDEKPKSKDEKSPAKGKPKATKKKTPQTEIIQFRILLPQSLMQQLLGPYMADLGATPMDPESPWGHHMRKSAETANVPVRAVVETCRMTVADCTRLEIGQIIDLPGVSLQAIGLETELNGNAINFSTAALGIYKSHRAVKLTENIDPDFSQDMKSL